MALHAHPTIPSDLTPMQAFDSDTGILHATLSDAPTLTLQYWVTKRLILPEFMQDRQEASYDVLYFTPFSTEAAWTRLYPENPILNTISVRLNETTPPFFPSLASSMSTSPTPATPPTYSYPSNKKVDPTTALIALMNQSLQQNAAIMAQIHSSPPLLSALQPLMSYLYKPQIPPFPKWDGTPPKTPIFLAQVTTYKAEAFYARVHDWTCTTPASRKLSVAIISHILASLPLSISSMLLNDARFTSDGITMLSLLITHLNPSSSKNLLLVISDLTRLNMQLGESSIDYMSRVRGISQRMQGITIERIIPIFAITSIDHDRYPCVKSRYLTGDVALVNYDLLELRGLLSSKEARQRALGIPSAPPHLPLSPMVC